MGEAKRRRQQTTKESIAVLERINKNLDQIKRDARTPEKPVLIIPHPPSLRDLMDERDEPTPGAHWREDGRPDPHGGRYDCPRDKLSGGHLSDDELAFECGMAFGRTTRDAVTLENAKDRIRWLSRQLAAKDAEIARLKGQSQQ